MPTRLRSYSLATRNNKIKRNRAGPALKGKSCPAQTSLKKLMDFSRMATVQVWSQHKQPMFSISSTILPFICDW